MLREERYDAAYVRHLDEIAALRTEIDRLKTIARDTSIPAADRCEMILSDRGVDK